MSISNCAQYVVSFKLRAGVSVMISLTQQLTSDNVNASIELLISLSGIIPRNMFGK